LEERKQEETFSWKGRGRKKTKDFELGERKQEARRLQKARTDFELEERRQED
jgi:hypothetical protein